jgi:hypothetical protein
MMKVHIRIPCWFCKGQAYLPAGEAESYTGERYIRYRKCAYCLGSGDQDKWVSLAEFIALLEDEKCPHKNTSHRGGFHFSSGDVWDDITEICDDCGENLDEITARQSTDGSDDVIPY